VKRTIFYTTNGSRGFLPSFVFNTTIVKKIQVLKAKNTGVVTGVVPKMATTTCIFVTDFDVFSNMCFGVSGGGIYAQKIVRRAGFCAS
jgi:predicted outer membrane repeat protein